MKHEEPEYNGKERTEPSNEGSGSHTKMNLLTLVSMQMLKDEGDRRVASSEAGFNSQHASFGSMYEAEKDISQAKMQQIQAGEVGFNDHFSATNPQPVAPGSHMAPDLLDVEAEVVDVTAQPNLESMFAWNVLTNMSQQA